MSSLERRYSRSPDRSSSFRYGFERKPGLPWWGHMDPKTAIHRAFWAGLVDGQVLNFGANFPRLGGDMAEFHYLRGYAIGVCDWRTSHVGVPDPLTERTPRESRHPTSPRMYGYFPGTVAAILPLPYTRFARPARHLDECAADFSVAFTAKSIREVPTPDGVYRDELAAHFPSQRRAQLFSLGARGCWIMPECRDTAPVLIARLIKVVEALLAFLWPIGNILTVEGCVDHADALQSRAVFVHGPAEQIRALVEGRVWATSWMCLFAHKNAPSYSRYAVTFESLDADRSFHEQVMWDTRDAFDSCAEAAQFCKDRGLVPCEVFSSLYLEYVRLPAKNGRIRHLWNVFMEAPFASAQDYRTWRALLSTLTPEDDAETEDLPATYMHAVGLECEVCGSCRHTAELCPTRAYEAWTGAVREPAS